MKFNIDKQTFMDFVSRFGFDRATPQGEDDDMSDSIFERDREKTKSTMNQSICSKDGKEVIAEYVVVNGSITSCSDLIIEGVVNGDIKCSGNIEIRGSVRGNVECANAVISGANISGDIVCPKPINSAERRRSTKQNATKKIISHS